MNATVSARLDRAGRILVVLGSLIVGPLIALPAFGVAGVLAITGGCGFADECDWGSGLVLLAVVAVALAAALLVTIAAAVRGGSDGLVLGGIGGLVVAVMGFIGLADAYQQGLPETLAAMYLLTLIAGGFALALGAAFRLIDRHGSAKEA